MKLFDVLKEDALQAFAGNRNINVYVGPDSVDEELIKSIQRAMAKHSLALGQRQEGSWWPNNTKAWTGGETGKFDPALGNAIRRWQESINIQIDDMADNTKVRKLTVNGVINQEDGKLLLAPLNNLGFLKNRELDNALANFKKVRRAFDGQRFVNSDVSQVTDYGSFLQAIGRDGWAAVLTPIANEQFKGQQFAGQTEINVKDWVDDGIDQILNKSRNADLLFDNLRAILRPLSPNFKTQNKIGGVVRLIPDFERLRFLQVTYLGPKVAREDLTKPKLLYLHFAGIAQYEFERDRRTIADRIKKQEAEDAKSEQNDTANFDQITARQLAEKIENAFKNNYFAVFTSARVESDEMSIEEALMQLANAKDYDAVAKEYNALTNTILSQRMVDELSPELYNRIFIAHLIRIKRINPRLYHSAIQFTGDSITVMDNGKEFEIMRVMSRDRPDIEPEVFDVLLEDRLLKEAIAQSGGELPDLYRQPSADERNAAINVFINVMNETYPEMVRFYAHLPPFQEYAPLGPLRLKGIIEEGTVYQSAGTDPSLFYEQSIAKDRIWLVGDGEDNDGDGEVDGGNANIYFDERYQQEGLDARQFEIPDNEEKIELNDDEMSIVRDLASRKEDLILDAIDRLFKLNNPKKRYLDTIYPGFKQETGQFIEEELGGRGDDAWTYKFFKENTTDSNPMMAALLTEFSETMQKSPLEVIAFVAPKGTADQFKEALERTTLIGLINNIDEPMLRKLFAALVSREDFDIVDKYYDGDLQTDIEDKDWWASDEDIAQRLAKIGVNPRKQARSQIQNEVDAIADELEKIEAKQSDEDLGEFINSINVMEIVNKLEEYMKEYNLLDGTKQDEAMSQIFQALNPYLFIERGDNPYVRGFAAGFEDTRQKLYSGLENYEQAREKYMELQNKYYGVE